MGFSVRLPPPVQFPSDVNIAPLAHISLDKLNTGDTQESIKLFEACKNDGFFMLDLQNNPLGEGLLEDADKILGLSDKIFGISLEEKQKFAMQKGSFAGYKGVGALRVNKKGEPDSNEFFGVLKDEVLGVSPVLNQPDVIKQHKELYASFTRRCEETSKIMLRELDKNLHLPPGTLESLHRIDRPSHNQTRLLRYAPQPSLERGSPTFVPHSDFGSITILFSVIGGLQILPEPMDSIADQNDSPSWQFVRPVPGHATINIGDSLMKFTNGLLKSYLHRVTYMPGEQGDFPRNSLGYFLRPENDVVLKRLDFDSDVIPPLEEGMVEEAVTASKWVDVKGSKERRDGK